MLGCSNNDFSGQDLSFLLKNSALEYLNIGYTNFSSGLEYVPDGVERFYCSYFDHEDKKIKFINQELMKYVKDVNPVIIERLTYQNQILESENSQLKNELQMEREEVEKALQKAQEWRERQLKEITEQKDAEIERLKEENANLKQLLDQQAQIEENKKVYDQDNNFEDVYSDLKIKETPKMGYGIIYEGKGKKFVNDKNVVLKVPYEMFLSFENIVNRDFEKRDGFTF
ncbi:16586_t:CDS:2 [Racocetra persica]|uniref:16586_t:CDS:1 n=1 Tax=Racocetra persica TaxID=160502 RepID=A0ACA9PK02_9GLOM|nr:16586_t:CDS:2 [Racocetra persica]